LYCLPDLADLDLDSFLVSFSTFALYAYTSKKPLTSQIVFPAISLFQLLQFPLSVLPMVFSSWIEAYVSITRLTAFLSANELQPDAVDRVRDSGDLSAGDELVSVSKGEFSWNSSQPEPTLVNINLSVKKGDLVAVVGRVGSGKSSLISATLGEMNRISGKVKIRGSVAYVSQNPWLQGATVRENIIFGHRFNQEFYDAVLDACAIRPDLAVLRDGDQTEIGEKGVTLSGGQRARISLARAVYSRADVILFDDPLSAVDSHVAKHLFENVIGPHGLLSSKARLLCTNNIAFVHECDELIMLRAGSIIERRKSCFHAESISSLTTTLRHPKVGS
jgi:ABC-type multidrug transport system fused ATPase/permease subunit